jgi:hypothetical protein
MEQGSLIPKIHDHTATEYHFTASEKNKSN